MYFRNRAEAGRKLAQKLDKFADQNSVVIALGPGAVIVGAQIAMRIHANLMLLLTEDILLPGESEAIASMSSAGTFAYNDLFSPGEVEELAAEYHQFIDQERIQKFHKLNKIIGADGEIHKDQLRRHVVILVSDGLASGFTVDLAADYLKTVAVKRLVIATPIASVPAVDRMHLRSDEICCLSVVQAFINTNHYYDENTIPPVSDLFRVTHNISLNWQGITN